jgi:hypothetical protein
MLKKQGRHMMTCTSCPCVATLHGAFVAIAYLLYTKTSNICVHVVILLTTSTQESQEIDMRHQKLIIRHKSTTMDRFTLFFHQRRTIAYNSNANFLHFYGPEYIFSHGIYIYIYIYICMQAMGPMT